MGNVYGQIGQCNEAKEFLEKVLIMKKKGFGEDHADVARSYHYLGNVYRFKQDDCRTKAREILKLCNQTKRKYSTSSNSSKLPRLENC